jgi:hypothetical protein
VQVGRAGGMGVSLCMAKVGSTHVPDADVLAAGRERQEEARLGRVSILVKCVDRVSEGRNRRHRILVVRRGRG